jgi:hypothetical protein
MGLLRVDWKILHWFAGGWLVGFVKSLAAQHEPSNKVSHWTLKLKFPYYSNHQGRGPSAVNAECLAPLFGYHIYRVVSQNMLH